MPVLALLPKHPQLCPLKWGALQSKVDLLPWAPLGWEMLSP